MGWSSAEAGDQHTAAPRPAEPAAVKLDDGSYLISGWMPDIEFAELLKIPLPVSRHPPEHRSGPSSVRGTRNWDRSDALDSNRA
jgi:hypothetical protein